MSAKNKITFKDYSISFFYNFVTAFVIGVIPTILYAMKSTNDEFKDFINGTMNNSFMLYYFVLVAAIGIIFKIHIFISTRNCGECEKSKNLGLLSSKLFEPFFSAMLGVSGGLIAFFLIAFVQSGFHGGLAIFASLGTALIFAISTFIVDLSE